jgi:hypothetical protein
MTYEEKLQALQALGECSLKMRRPGDWYVAQPQKGVHSGGILRSPYGNGRTPEEAVENHWFALTSEVAPDEYVVLHPGDSVRRRAVRWNGFMWADVDENKEAR